MVARHGDTGMVTQACGHRDGGSAWGHRHGGSAWGHRDGGSGMGTQGWWLSDGGSAWGHSDGGSVMVAQALRKCREAGPWLSGQPQLISELSEEALEQGSPGPRVDPRPPHSTRTHKETTEFYTSSYQKSNL